MIVDCFTFFNEFDLLEIRLHELDPYVDRFVLVESAETFTGHPKPLWFAERGSGYLSEFRKKLVPLVAPPANNPKSAWDREQNQRDHIMAGIGDLGEEDLVIVSDVDEIPRGRDFERDTREHRAGRNANFLTPMVQNQYFFYLNLLREGGWPGPVLVTYSNLKTVFGGSPHKARLMRRHGLPLKRGGWHFTFMGGADAVMEKARAYSHFGSKMANSLLDPEKLLDRMERSRAVKAVKLRAVEVDSSFPLWLRENRGHYKHMLTEVDRIE